MAPDREAVRDAVEALRDRGRSHIKSRDVAKELAVDENTGTLTGIGHHLRALAEDGLIEVYSEGGSSKTYRIVESDETEVSA